ncbi:hypothetical protein C8P66_11734 [Humitalea rosea]|uniref:Uncharacterized protein n=1 Tax=Humitalea rosea TaxID=990373 RepID=A0A2W7I9F6_9PROT|nr:hypothetical protein [Humitalea rosea]PZW43009.1 hypothetical protein C8P66_11734 [Humitalea rosea]
MSLLDDLQGLDLSGIVNARASITVTIDGPDLRGLIEHGPIGALGDIGDRLEELRALGDDPTALFGALLGAVGGLAGGFSADGFPVARYVSAVAEGGKVVADLLREVDGTPASWLRALKLPVGDGLSTIGRNIDDFGRATLGDTGRFTHAMALAGKGFSSDPAALIEQGLGFLLPFGGADLGGLRRLLDGTLPALAAFTLPATRTAGLLTALGDVRLAASGAGSDVAVQAAVTAALARLAEARAATVSQIRRDLLDLQGRLTGLRLPQVLAPLTTAAETFRTGEAGFREMMTELRGFIRGAKEDIDTLDAAKVEDLIAMFEEKLDAIEANAKAEVETRIDALADELIAYVRSFLGHLHLSELRDAMHSRFESAANAIRDAELDRFARQAQERLAGLRGLLSAGDLGDQLRAPLQQIAQVVAQAVTAISDALEAIAAAVTALVDQARALLEQAVELLHGFKAALDEVVAAIDGLGIESATQSILDRLSELRQKAQDLLSGVELPEPLRPVVEQLVEELRALDLDALLLDPVRQQAEKLTLSAALRGRLSAVLGEVDKALKNIVPASLIESIEAELNRATEAFASLSSARLVAELQGLFSTLADAVAKLDPVPALDVLRKPFVALLGAVDAVKPDNLLRPVLEAYDSALGHLALPDPAAAATSGDSFMSSSADTLGKGLTAPLGPTLGAAPKAAGTPTLALPGLPPGTRPGDFVRLLGLLPRKLKEAVAALEAGPLAEAETAFSRLTTGLAADLRGIEGALWDIEDRLDAGLEALLQPLAAAEVEAGFAIHGRLQLGPVQLDATADALAAASPGALRAELREAMAPLRVEIRRTISGLGPIAVAVESIAGGLERAVAGAEGGLAAFLDLLDPEPLALEVDALIIAAMDKFPVLALALRDRVAGLLARFSALVRDYGPAMLALRFRRVLNAVREELDVLDPHRLVADLDLVHAALREAVAAYDPAVIATEMRAAVLDLSATLRGIDVAAALGDLSFLDDAIAGLAAASPTAALQGVGADLEEIGATLAELNPGAMLEAVDRLGPRVVEQFARAVGAVRAEIATLLDSLQFAASGGSASASVSVGGGD